MTKAGSLRLSKIYLLGQKKRAGKHGGKTNRTIYLEKRDLAGETALLLRIFQEKKCRDYPPPNSY
jgi:hypothetical protein